MARVLVPLLIFAVTFYALVDAIQTPEERVRHLPKMIWIGLIVLVPVLGPVAWLVIGRERRIPKRGRSPRTRGPDDDPDFLRGL